MLSDWTDKKNYIIHYRILKIYVRHGMIVEKIRETISFKESKRLEKYIFILIFKNEIGLKMTSKKISTNYLLTKFMEKQWKM